MKQTLRNLFVFSSFCLTCLSASGGCSSDPSQPIGIGSGATAAGGSAAGTFGTSGTATGGSGTAGTATAGTAAGGTFGSAGTATGGTFSSAGTATGGTFGSSGTAAGGTFSSSGTGGSTAGGAGAGGGGTGGAAGGGAGGTSSAGTGGSGGAAADDFPANCPMPSATAHAADKLTKTCWKASASSCSLGNAAPLVNPPSNTVDADVATRFSTGVNMTASMLFKFDVDMGKAVMINGVSTTTTDATDAPPQIEVDVSTDGTAWTPVACGANSVAADISFAPVSARYVRLVQHGINTGWWSLTDLEVYRSGADDTCGAGNTTTACTTIGAAFPDTCCGESHKL